MSEIIIHNVENDEVVIREMTADELKTIQQINDEAAARQVEIANARLALLEKLGLTEAEVRLLLG